MGATVENTRFIWHEYSKAEVGGVPNCDGAADAILKGQAKGPSKASATIIGWLRTESLELEEA